MVAGVTSSAIAAIVVALVSLSMHSPDDTFFNSATVAIGALFAGVIAGAIWHFSAGRAQLIRFVAFWTIGFVVVALLTFVGAAFFDNFLSFVLPLAAIVFGVTGLLTALFADNPIFKARWVSLIAIALALGIGFGLATQSDQESGRLELPPRSSNSSLPSAREVGNKVPS